MDLGLDIRTLAIVLAVTLAIAALVLALLYHLHPTIPGLREWAVGMGLVSAGFFLIFARGSISNFMSVVCANGIITLGYVVIYLGVLRFSGLRQSLLVPGAIALGTTISFFFLYESDQFLSARIMIGSASSGLLSMMIATALMQHSSPGLTARRVTAAIYILHGAVNLLRSGWMVFAPPVGGLMDSGASTVILYGWSIAAIFAFTAGTVIMTTEQLRDALNARICELNEAHSVARTALENERQIMREQRNFLAMVSHEFRTPLSIIDAATDVVEYNLSEIDQESTEELARIRRAVQRLTNLVDSCIADEWLESNTDTRKTVEVDIRALLADLAAEHDIPFKLVNVSSTIVNGDPYLLPIAVSNLIDNARKYGLTRGGISMQCAQETSNEIVAEVSDDGPGIDDSERPHIFEKFYRSPHVGRKPGAGLGLYLVKRIVTLHGGRIEVVTGHGSGSTFRIVLPLQIQSATRG